MVSTLVLGGRGAFLPPAPGLTLSSPDLLKTLGFFFVYNCKKIKEYFLVKQEHLVIT